MRNLQHNIALATALFAFALPPTSASAQQEPIKTFPVAKVRFEQNATDGDVEFVCDVIGRRDGLTSLTITTPDGRKIVDFSSDASKGAAAGIRQFVFESPEPKDIDGLKTAFPEGMYTFDGTAASGAKLHGSANLVHALPSTTAFVVPKADAQNVPTRQLKITWSAVAESTAFVIELEQSKLKLKINARLPANVTSFAVPDGLLQPGTKYQLGLGTVNKDGNISFVETSFTTANDSAQ